MASGWSFLAGFANTLGGRLQSDYEMEQKQKLSQMQQDAEMKRQQFLEKYRSDLEMERDKAKDERQKDDVVGTFKDPETGSWFGRTRSGGSVPLHATSDDYQSDLAAGRDVKLDKDKTSIDVNKERIDKMRKEVENYDSLIGNRGKEKAPKEDPINKDIRSTYKSDIDRQQREVAAKRAAMLKANPQADPATLPAFDPDQAAQGAAARVYKQYGAERAKNVLNGIQGIKADAPPQQQSPTQPSAPSPEALMQQANEAIKRGAPQDKVEARLKQLMSQYGYSPQ